MTPIKRFCLFFLFVLLPFTGWSNSLDTLQLKDGTLLVGEIKRMERGVLVMEVEFSEKNLEISFSKIIDLSSDFPFLIALENGQYFEAEIDQINADSISIQIIQPTKRQQNKLGIQIGDIIHTSRADVIQFFRIRGNSKGRFDGEIGLGFNMAKANNLRQFSLQNALSYNGSRFLALQYFNGIRSVQSETQPIKRYEASLVGLYYLPKEWFVLGWVSFLSNTQQLLDLRTGYKLGFGKYIFHTQKATWMVTGGLNLNREKFREISTVQSSTEGVISSQLQIKDFSIFDINASLNFYDSFTEANRIRSDFRLDIRYDFLNDFYLKLGTAINYDNQPTEGGTNTDYIIQSTIGWIF
ncbi:MAG: DUF481 domain-containing protein [Cyclobacteriaceae bacterium]|nr:DUF481 domain-containing protein [Cyclobacteriaceae bacterium]